MTGRRDASTRADVPGRVERAGGGDSRTLAVYADGAERYADLTDKCPPGLTRFMESLPPGADVLDLGCGPGNHAARMSAAGFAVTAWDASPGMATEALRRHGLAVRVATFSDLADVAAFDGVWASFSLLHAPRPELPVHLSAIRRALRPGGVVRVGMKTGEGSGRDRLGRYYTYVSEEELETLLTGAGFEVRERSTGADAGFDGVVSPWVEMQGHA